MKQYKDHKNKRTFANQGSSLSPAVSPSVGYFLFLQIPCHAASGLFLYLVFFCCACPRQAALAHFSTASVCFLWHCTTLTNPELPPSTGLFLLMSADQTTCGVGECTSIYMVMCEQWAYKASMPVCVFFRLLSSCPLSVLFLWSPPLAFSLPLWRHRLGVKSSSEIHPQSLKFPPADFLGQTGTRFNQSWDKSGLTTLLYPPHRPRYSLVLLHISQSLMFGNREQRAVQLFDSIFCRKQSLYLSQQMNVQMDTDGYCISMVQRWETGFVCVSEHQVCVVILFEFFPPFLSLFLLAPWITQNAFTPWQPGGLLSLPSHTERERERGRKEDKAEIMSVHVCVCVCVCVCACERT